MGIAKPLMVMITVR